MDKQTEDFETLLKELTPKQLSHGARWNLDQRLSDLDTLTPRAKATRRSPRLIWFTGAAAAMIIAAITWAVATSTTSELPGEVIAQPGTGINTNQPVAVPPEAK